MPVCIPAGAPNSLSHGDALVEGVLDGADDETDTGGLEGDAHGILDRLVLVEGVVLVGGGDEERRGRSSLEGREEGVGGHFGCRRW